MKNIKIRKVFSVGVVKRLIYVTLFISALVGIALAEGALAIDSNQGNQYGFSYDYSNMWDAESRALSECGYGCKIVLRVPTGCGAYAADKAYGSTVYGWGKASSEYKAKKVALDYCAAYGGTQCVVRTWTCNSY